MTTMDLPLASLVPISWPFCDQPPPPKSSYDSHRSCQRTSQANNGWSQPMNLLWQPSSLFMPAKATRVPIMPSPLPSSSACATSSLTWPPMLSVKDETSLVPEFGSGALSMTSIRLAPSQPDTTMIRCTPTKTHSPVMVRSTPTELFTIVKSKPRAPTSPTPIVSPGPSTTSHAHVPLPAIGSERHSFLTATRHNESSLRSSLSPAFTKRVTPDQFRLILKDMRAKNPHAPRMVSLFNPIREQAPFRVWDTLRFRRPGNLTKPVDLGLRSRTHCNSHGIQTHNPVEFFLCAVPKSCSDCSKDGLNKKVLLRNHFLRRIAAVDASSSTASATRARPGSRVPAGSILLLNPDAEDSMDMDIDHDLDLPCVPDEITFDAEDGITGLSLEDELARFSSGEDDDWMERIPDSPHIEDLDDFEGSDEFASPEVLRLF